MHVALSCASVFAIYIKLGSASHMVIFRSFFEEISGLEKTVSEETVSQKPLCLHWSIFIRIISDSISNHCVGAGQYKSITDLTRHLYPVIGYISYKIKPNECVILVKQLNECVVLVKQLNECVVLVKQTNQAIVFAIKLTRQSHCACEKNLISGAEIPNNENGRVN
ncbi:uncharacterized protein LOC114536145 [Dendronephthya gigantea]|uniref:uncharacterized protein LOC114536145 n=1 Tax=Dendronephthya gigantea TaxID=151771 RepID=UPI001068FBE6|nr:uncharacterized protein LOC114536145 [Dendronephthya gigantea]